MAQVFLLVTIFAVTYALDGTPARPNVEKAEVPGIKHFSRLNDSIGYAGPVVGLGGATNALAITGLKREGFVTAINLRLADEEGATVAASRLAAEAVGLNYIHLPFNPQNPAPDLVDKFLRAVGEESNQPVFIHCNSATRVAALWMIGRVVKDGWELDDAATEAESIAMKPDEAIAFASAYLERLK
jgi:uncharacterized protein (TIGR01244 family)